MKEKIKVFNAKLLEIFNLHVPLKRRHFKNLPAPWLTVDIRAAMHRRDMARRAWRRHKTDYYYNQYKFLRNETQSLVRSTKSAFYIDAFSRVGSANEVWDRLRLLGLVKARVSLCASRILLRNSLNSLDTVGNILIWCAVILLRTYSRDQ